MESPNGSRVRRTKICIVLGGHISAQIGGAQYQAKSVVEVLKQTGRFDIYYLTRSTHPDYKPDGYSVVQIAKPAGLRRYSFAFDTPYLLARLRSIGPDVIYQRCLNPHTGIVAWYSRRNRCRSVFHIASDYDLLPPALEGAKHLRWLRRIEQRMGEYGLKSVDDVIAQTRHQAQLLEQHFGRAAAAVVPNVQPAPTERIVKDMDRIRILWIANFKRVKQPEVFVRLAQDLSNHGNLSFVMIGRAGNPEKYGRLQEKIRGIPNLTFTGELPLERVNEQLAKGHIFVNTSQAEGFPNTFIQSWMRKVPTLSLAVDPDGLLQPGEIGYCARGNYDALKAKIVELANDHALRQQMGDAAQRYALGTHSMTSMGRLVEILETPSAGRPAPARRQPASTEGPG